MAVYSGSQIVSLPEYDEAMETPPEWQGFVTAVRAARGQVFDYEQDEDPTAVASQAAGVTAGKWWFQTNTLLLFRRNDANDAWQSVIAAGGAPPPVDPEEPEEPPTEPPDVTIVNIADTGLIMDGVTDQSAAWQALLNASPNGTEFRFPTSPVGPLCIKNIICNNRHYLTFVGPSKDTTSILWNGIDNEGIMTFQQGCTNITFRNMGICNRAVKRFGGMRHFDAHDFLYDTCKFFDDQPIPLTTTEDRYSIVFGFGGAATFSTDIEIKDCVFENLQCEVDHSKNVHVHGCTSSYSKSTAAFGFWHRSHNSVMEDYLIENNTINAQVRSTLGAITFFHDVAGLNFCSTQRIIIRNNTINHLSGLNINGEALIVNPGITIGGPTGTAQGNINKDITIEGNDITVSHGTNLKDPHGAISLYGVSGASIDFDNVSIKDNRITSLAFTSTSFGITARRLKNSTIDGNVVNNCATGIKVAGAPVSNVILTNNLVVNSLSAYRLANVTGGVSLDTTNEYFSSPEPLFTASISGTNVLTGPAELSVQSAAPSADTFIGDWTDESDGTTNIFNSINETVADDNDFIQSEESPSASPYVTKLTTLDDPVADFAHTLNYRYQKDFDGGEVIDITVQIRQGYVNEGTPGTLIASNFHGDISGVDSIDGSLSLTPAECDAITDPTDLYARVVANVP